MLQNGEKKPVNKKLIIWVAALLLTVFALTAVLFAGGFAHRAVEAVVAVFTSSGTDSSSGDVSSRPDVGIIDPDSPQPPSDLAQSSQPDPVSGDEPEIPFAKPDKVRGVWLNPGTDFLKSSGMTYTAAMTEWEQLLNQLPDYHFNTVILPVNWKNQILYPDATGGGYVLGDEKQNLLEGMLKKAREKGIYVFCVYSMMRDVSLDVLTARTLSNLRELAKLMPDGLFVRDYHQSANPEIYAEYMSSGGGMGLDFYMQDQLTSLMKKAAGTVKAVSKKIYFGVVAHPVWAVKSQREAGLAGTSGFTALGTGHADTLGWLNAGLLDCVMVENDRSTTASGINFGAVAAWWTAAAEKAGREVLFSHSSDKVAAKAAGFEPDQLIRQVMALEKLRHAGSIFNSFSALRQDTTGGTANLIKYFEGKVEPSFILKTLSISNPTKTTFTTNESSLTIRGASDPNFALTMNGHNVERSDMGFFSLKVDLKPGVNKFKFEHKGKTLTYTITYQLIIIKEYFPAAAQSVRGSTNFTVSVLALRDANVTAALGGTTIKLVPTDEGADETPGGKDSSLSFVTYTGTFQIPAAKTKEQDLGAVTFKASHSGQTATRTGGRVTVRADETAVIPGGGEYANVKGEYAAEVIIDQAETFNGKTTDDYSNPLNNYLPKGTIDYCDPNPVKGPDGTYQLWRFGRRTYVSSNSSGTNIKVYKAKLPETNSITVQSLTADARHTTLVLDTIWKAPFMLAYDGDKDYVNPNPAKGAPSFLLKSSFTAKYVDITFCYAATGQGVADFGEDNPLFSKAEWFKGTRDYTLRLHLKKPGVFYGWSANYNASGQLVFKFLHPARIDPAAEKPLTGTKIVVDPGHGGGDPGALGYNSNFSEKELALKISLKLRDQLAAMGAQVILTRDKDGDLKMKDRAALTREVEPDIFVSVHLNANPSSSASGYENYYFSPFSQKLAGAVYNKASQHFTNKRGVKWYPYFVTRVSNCPSILTENGFVSNSREYEWLLKDANQETVAKSTAQGILDYFKSIQ